MKKLVIIGAGGFGREVLQLARHQNNEHPRWEILGFVDDSAELQDKIINDYPVLGGLDWLAANAEGKHAVIALGEPELKKQVETRLQDSGIRYATLVHPSAVTGDYVSIGEGSIITAGVVLTVNINIGRHVIINLNSCVGHDVVVEDYVTISPDANIMGNSTLGTCCYIASGVTVRDKVAIGASSIIGLGAVVTGDIPGDIVAVGCPARKIRDNTTRKVFNN